MRVIYQKLTTVLALLLLFSLKGFSQDKIITGKIQTANGTGISNATLSTNGSKKTTITDSLGGFQITVTNADKKVIVSSIGFLSNSFTLSFCFAVINGPS